MNRVNHADSIRLSGSERCGQCFPQVYAFSYGSLSRFQSMRNELFGKVSLLGGELAQPLFGWLASAA